MRDKKLSKNLTMLTDQEIKDRLLNFEDNFTERKTEGDHKDFLKTICGFANSVLEGQIAILFIGVKNDGTIQGIKGMDSLQKTVKEICEKKCYPKVIYQTRIMQKDNKNYLAVLIPHNKDKPHFSGPAFVRKGSETIVASDEMFEELIYSRTSKVAEILKWKDKLITVEAIRKKLGSTESLGDSRYRDVHECKLIECNPHFVRMNIISSDKYISEPLTNIVINYDEKKYRLKLIVTPNPV
ncbi:MAG: ATP-binding protein [Nitrospirota bacterium]